MFDIQEELKKLPGKPGVYIMHDAKDTIIYVGKAISLKNRVRQYFQSSRNLGVKKEQMVQQIARFEYIITDSELEALVLECNLIKEHRPKYNTMLKDDKTYPYLKVTVNEEYPRVLFVRRMKKDKAKYFGPYTSSNAVKDSMELIRKLYHVRTCNRNLPRDIGKERPCLYYHIKQCKAPCQGYISKEEYQKQIEGVLDFLNGDYKKLLKELEEKIRERFFGIELFIRKCNNLHHFITCIKADQTIKIGEEELKRGVLAWDMGRMVCLTRIAYDAGFIDESLAWNYICSAGQQCIQAFNDWTEVGKSFLLGQAMEATEKRKQELYIRLYRQATENPNSPWKKRTLK